MPVSSIRTTLGESPLFAGGRIYWTDVNGGRLHWADPTGGDGGEHRFGTPCVAVLATDDPDLLIVVLGDGLLLWSHRRAGAERIVTTLPEWPRYRYNDAAIDGRNCLWIGVMMNNIAADGAHLPIADDKGRIVRVDAAGRSRTVAEGLGCPNGLAFAPDGRRGYWADSATGAMVAATLDDAGLPAAIAPFGAREVPGVPDGSAVDTDGGVWNARFGGGCVVRYTPDGEVDRVVDLPVTNPTCCCFGGERGTTLFVTSARLLAPADEPLAGALIAVEVGVAGLAPPRFAPDALLSGSSVQ